MKRPKSVLIGPCKWKVKWGAKKIKKHESFITDAYGLSVPMENTIYVDDALPLDSQREIFFHELLHSIMSTYQIAIVGSKEDREEALVGTLSPLLLDTLKRNSDMAEWLMEA